MRTQILISVALAGLTAAAPHPQKIDVDGVAAAPAPVIVSYNPTVAVETATVAAASDVAASASAEIATNPAVTGTPEKRDIDCTKAPAGLCNVAAVKRDVDCSKAPAGLCGASSTKAKRDNDVSDKKSVIPTLEKRSPCEKQPDGYGPVPSTDSVAAFQAFTTLQDLANNAPTPQGYSLVFKNKAASVSASNYMGLYTLKTFDTLTCQSKCDQAAGCVAFNMFAERNPSIEPAPACPDPASITNFKCTLWGAPIAEGLATNDGQWRDQFHVVIAASNGYNKASPPPAIDGYKGPTSLGGAIQAPSDANGHDTYMGYKFYPFSQSQGYTPSTCASACDATTAFNKEHLRAADGSYQSCAFFNAYVLSENGIPQGLYCSMYNQTWSAEYGTNYGQYRGDDRYTVSQSYSYSKSSGLMCADVKCPTNNNQVCTNTDGTKSSLQCGMDYGFGDIGSTTVANFGECSLYAYQKQSAGQHPLGFVYFPDRGNTQCYVYADNNTAGYAWDAAWNGMLLS